MFASFHPLEDTQDLNNKFDDLESPKNNYQTQLDSLPPLLPRSAWNSQLAFLRVLFRAKKALDKIEQEADLLRN